MVSMITRLYYIILLWDLSAEVLLNALLLKLGTELHFPVRKEPQALIQSYNMEFRKKGRMWHVSFFLFILGLMNATGLIQILQKVASLMIVRGRHLAQSLLVQTILIMEDQIASIVPRIMLTTFCKPAVWIQMLMSSINTLYQKILQAT